jgi:oligopeptide/dipeptide ABC transporter ATP-binding protein
MENTEKILEIRDLSTRFRLVSHTVEAVDGISFHLGGNEILAIAGESGCGKSAAILSILKLIRPPGEIDGKSEIIFQGRNILELREKELNALRGKSISMIFQEPSASFNPLFTVGGQIAEVLRIHEGLEKKEALSRAVGLLDQVRIPNPDQRAADYPFQLSGGMLQRAMIALAISCSPRILLADEPTTALDPTTQIQILELLKERTTAAGMSMIFVTHDLELLKGFANRILVMYAGRIFESGAAADILTDPRHPYTRDLLSAVPRPGVFKDETRLHSIRGRVPEAGNRPQGCSYHPRCSRAFGRCETEEPPLFENKGSEVRCWLYE